MLPDFQSPDDLRFRMAEDLSRSITGTTLHIDGGTIASLGFLDWPDDSFMPAPLGGAISRLFPKPR